MSTATPFPSVSSLSVTSPHERKGALAAVAVKNKFTKGDSLELMTPQGNMNFTLEHLENGKGEAIEVAPGDGHTVWLRFRKRWS